MKKIPMALAAVMIVALLGTEAFAAVSPMFVLPLGLKVGWVLNYQPGVSITIQDKFGNLSSFALTSETRILPRPRANELMVGSLVTILARRDPRTHGWIAFGIVVHPAGTGPQQPATPTMTPAPSDTPTSTATETSTATPTDTPTSTPTSIP